MKEPKFWWLRGPESTAGLAGWAEGENRFEKIVCPQNPEHSRIGARISHLSIVLAKTVVPEIVWIWGGERVIRDHVVELFQENKLKGYELKPVKARFDRASDGNPPDLRELVVTGWGGMGRPESGVRLIKEYKCCGYQKYTGPLRPELFIDMKQWDGSDFFMVWPLPMYIFVTERVRKLARDAKLKGVRLLPMEKMKPVDEATPGRLRDWMPELRARTLGEPLGIY
jgi:hypothetical protein